LKQNESNGPDELLANFGKALRLHEEDILAGSLELFRQSGEDPYTLLMLDTPEGKVRMSRWTRLAIGAFMGDREPLRQDVARIAFLRAKQGFDFSDLFKVLDFFIISVFKTLKAHPECYGFDHDILLMGMQRLFNIAHEYVKDLAQSFITTREDIIADNVAKLHRIYRFTQRVMNTFSQKDIMQLTENEITKLFSVSQCYLALNIPGAATKGIVYSADRIPNTWQIYSEEVWRDDLEIYLDSKGSRSSEVTLFKRKSTVIAPLRGFEKRYGTVIISNSGRPFAFGRKERYLLFQLLYIAAMMLENSFMVRQLERRSSRLRMLTMRISEVGEEERKRVSEHIHDTLTQTLTGINYKLQFCQEIAETNPDQLQQELRELVTTVQGAIKQSRDIISSLHPDIIDNIGLVSALDNYFGAFMEKTGIYIEFSCPEQVEFPADITRHLYRMACEALVNVHKHSDATAVAIGLKIQNKTIVLQIQDNGRPLNQSSSGLVSPERGKFGLFYVQQRMEALNGSLKIELPATGGVKLTAMVPLENA
jgi:signal transduction histidine kinase